MHSRILKEAERSGLIMQSNSTLLVTYDGQVRDVTIWEPGPQGINRCFHNRSLIKAGRTLADGAETIVCVDVPDDNDEFDNDEELDDRDEFTDEDELDECDQSEY
jgi:hypothetical protein